MSFLDQPLRKNSLHLSEARSTPSFRETSHNVIAFLCFRIILFRYKNALCRKSLMCKIGNLFNFTSGFTDEISVTANKLLVRTPLYRSVELSCTFSGFPQSISWMGADGKQIPQSSSQYLITNTNTNHYLISRLKITQVMKESYGEYKCVGENEIGKGQQRILIRGEVLFSLL